MKKIITLTLAIAIIAPLYAQEKIDTAMVSKIKKEGFDHSQVMTILSMLTDVHGPRLTNSPGYKKLLSMLSQVCNPGAYKM